MCFFFFFSPFCFSTFLCLADTRLCACKVSGPVPAPSCESSTQTDLEITSAEASAQTDLEISAVDVTVVSTEVYRILLDAYVSSQAKPPGPKQ